jgi:hopanoid biosynthesis associated RND transporter like protein HpnN
MSTPTNPNTEHARGSGSAWIAWLSRHSGSVLLMGLLLSLASLGLFFQYGALNSDLSKLIKPSDSLVWYQDNERYKAAFPQFQQTAVIVIRGTDYREVQAHTKRLVQGLPEETLGDVFAPGVDPFLAARKPMFLTQEQLEQWLKGADYNQGPLLRLMDEASLANVLFTYADFVSANPGQELPVSLESVRQGIVGGDLSFQGYYPLQPEGNDFTELIIVSGQQQLGEALPNAAIVSSLRQAIERHPAPDGVAVALTGEVALAHEEMSAALGGVELAGLLSLIFLALILHLGIRSGPILAAIGAMLAMGVSLTLGFATLAVGELNTLSMIFVVLFFGLGVDFGAHFTLRVQSCLRGDMRPALIQALHETGPALILCTLTSAASFLAFLPTDYRGFAELGLISAGGIVIALSLTLTVIPALLLRWPPRPQDPARKMLVTPLLRRLRASIDRLPKPAVVGFFGLVSLASVWLAKDLQFDYSVLAMRDADSPAMRALLDLQQDRQTTDYSVHVLAPDAAAAGDLKDRLLSLSTVGGVTTPADFVPTAQQAKANLLAARYDLLPELEAPQAVVAEDPELTGLALEYLRDVAGELQGTAGQQAQQVLEDARAMADDPEQVAKFEAQLLTQLPMALAELKALMAAQPFTLDDVPEHFRSRLITSGGQQLVSVNPASQLNDRQATDAFIAEVSSTAPNAAGRSVVEWGIGAVVVESFQQATVTAFGSIFALLLVYFRGWKFPLLVLTPIAMTVVLTFAVCVLLGVSLNMANILMVPLILGLGVDTGIHIVHRHRQAQSGAEAMDPAIRRAVMISGLTTVGTFCSLSLSPHQGAASIGLLLTVAIGLLLVISLVLMPILLRWFAPVSEPSYSATVKR